MPNTTNSSGRDPGGNTSNSDPKVIPSQNETLPTPDCELFVEPHEGFAIAGKDGEHLVYKLKKSLYGLKQSSRNWNYVLHSYLVICLIASSCTATLMNVNKNLAIRFKMKDLRKLAWFLGLEFIFEEGTIKINQTQYITKVLSKFKISKPRSTPCEMSASKVSESDSELGNVRLYREIVGSLVYIMTATSPDLCYSVTKLSQYLAKPTLMHLSAAKHVLRYLKGTTDRNLVY